MIECQLCKQEKEAKSNTHYLTDYIIKTAINEDGSNIREKGLYWSFDSDNPFIEFKFQRETSIPKVEKILGREVTEEEREDVMQNRDFSVDDKFCHSCEAKFKPIEDAFHDKLLDFFRKQNLTGGDHIIFDKEESKILRLFFLMQIWRAAVCEDSFILSDDLKEKLRIKILNTDYDDLESIPLAVYYLQTLPENDEKGAAFKTGNIVEVQEGENPIIILMNDFYVQLYEDLNFPFESVFGFNNQEDYIDYLNVDKTEFFSKIIHDKERREILYNIFAQETDRLEYFKTMFIKYFIKSEARKPSIVEVGRFMSGLIENSKNDKNAFSKEGITKQIKAFFNAANNP